MTTHWTDQLIALRACNGAVEWAREQPDLATAWATCERGDWMLWLAGRLSGPPEGEGRKTLVLAACDCAELSLRYIREEWSRDVAAATLEVTRAWAHGEADIARVCEARYVCWDAAAAYAAAADAYADAYAAAAYAAAAAARATERVWQRERLQWYVDRALGSVESTER